MEKYFSEDYLKQLQGLHQKKSFGDRPDYSKFKKWIDRCNPQSIIDYGCGKGNLVDALQQEYNYVEGYDPAVEQFRQLKRTSYDYLISTDVLEHIEYEYIDSVLQHMNSLFSKGAYIIIATTPARNFLPDGRNAHLIQEEPDWWKEKITNFIDAQIVYERHKKRIRRNLPNNRYIIGLEKI